MGGTTAGAVHASIYNIRFSVNIDDTHWERGLAREILSTKLMILNNSVRITEAWFVPQ